MHMRLLLQLPDAVLTAAAACCCCCHSSGCCSCLLDCSRQPQLHLKRLQLLLPPVAPPAADAVCMHSPSYLLVLLKLKMAVRD